jgi:hypothetical protein
MWGTIELFLALIACKLSSAEPLGPELRQLCLINGRLPALVYAGRLCAEGADEQAFVVAL